MSNYEKHEENDFAENFVDFFLISHRFNIERPQGDGCFCTMDLDNCFMF